MLLSPVVVRHRKLTSYKSLLFTCHPYQSSVFMPGLMEGVELRLPEALCVCVCDTRRHMVLVDLSLLDGLWLLCNQPQQLLLPCQQV